MASSASRILTFVKFCNSSACRILNVQSALFPLQISQGGNYCRRLSSDSDAKKDAERIKLYYKDEVQALLRQVTGKDYTKIFKSKKLGQKLREPKYVFMTDEEFTAARNDAEKKADELLQMPPVLAPRKPIDRVLSFDPQLQGLDTATFMFTDISLNVSNRDRIIVARDPDGTLREATWAERDKMNSIYFPIKGRNVEVPKMFTDLELLDSILERATESDNTYLYVLDRACIQFEPDDPLYIAAVNKVYDKIESKRHYEFLKSTRHFGPMAFYLIRLRMFDNLLLHSIKQRRIYSDVIPLIQLFHIVFPENKSVQHWSSCQSDSERVRKYIELDAVKKEELELAFNHYEEVERQKLEYKEHLHKAHGASIEANN